MNKIKKALFQRFSRYGSCFQPLIFRKRVPFYKIIPWVIQRIIIYTVLGRQNHILPIKFPTLSGIKMRSYHSLLGGLRYFGWWENEVHNFFLDYVPRAESFLEIGAMDGFYEVVARKINPDCFVRSVEPETGAYKRIAENFALNGINTSFRFEFIDKFVTGESDQNSITLSDLITKLVEPIFIIMDIDGGEGKVVQTSIDVLKKRKIYFLIETHSINLENMCKNALEKNGFSVRLIKNAWWRIFWPEERPSSHNRWLFATNVF